ncbi:hypothetical protein A6U85_10665 [Agrobacterium sp. 13-626]|nr:hypothetical protein DXT98_25590 [Agrobacterium sp. ICMP 7243]KEA09177.1 hypothetical protein CN09_26300 [Rhizobium rhizogenes]OCJ02087.1 hypothetical protein A6U85_10665 [Agrobacterium sp. 13-626]OCJ10694.1 hypothetical protein A6U88_20515 [Agrobacterium sp. B131/95]OCJ15537.1 hypothetical protein A6U89_20070 [Agrobacterium sp. B133/95]
MSLFSKLCVDINGSGMASSIDSDRTNRSSRQIFNATKRSTSAQAAGLFGFVFRPFPVYLR